MTTPPQLAGYAFSLSSAFLWAWVTISYKNISLEISPFGMNIGKSLLAVLCCIVILLIKGFEPVENKSLLFLIISGACGISLGDTFFFMSIRKLKSSVALLITTLIPALTVLLSVIFLGENPSPSSWGGIMLVIIGIAIVASKENSEHIEKATFAKGVTYGVISSICCAASVIFAKCALASASPLEAASIRQLSGLTFLIVGGAASAHLKLWIKPLLTDIGLTKKLFVAAFSGTFLGTWFCLIGLKLSPASTTTVLNATSPLFILPLSYLLLKEKFSSRSILGPIIAVIGVCLILRG